MIEWLRKMSEVVRLKKRRSDKMTPKRAKEIMETYRENERNILHLFRQTPTVRIPRKTNISVSAMRNISVPHDCLIELFVFNSIRRGKEMLVVCEGIIVAGYPRWFA